METLLVVAIVGAAAVYLGRRALRTLRGRSCGCGTVPGNCPAARTLQADLEQAIRRAGRTPTPRR